MLVDTHEEDYNNLDDFVEGQLTKFGNSLYWSNGNIYGPRNSIQYIWEVSEKFRRLHGNDSIGRDLLRFIDNYPEFKKRYITDWRSEIRYASDLEDYLNYIEESREKIVKLLFRGEESGSFGIVFSSAIRLNLRRDSIGLQDYLRRYMVLKFSEQIPEFEEHLTGDEKLREFYKLVEDSRRRRRLKLKR